MLVLVLEEGKMAKVHYVVTSKKQEKKMTGSDWVITIVYYGVLVLLFTLYAAIALGRDIASFDSSHIDNLIGFAALLMGIMSIPNVKAFPASKQNRQEFRMSGNMTPFFSEGESTRRALPDYLS